MTNKKQDMTSTLKKDTQKHLVTYGNYGFASAVGNPTLFVKAGKVLSYNVAPGQLVAYVIESGVTRIVAPAALDATEIYKLYVGVGVDEYGVGRTTAIRHLGIEHIAGCLPQAVQASSPRCGAPQIVDFYFECTKCDETYSVMVTVDDNQTRSFSPWNKSMSEFVGTIVTSCSACDDCDVAHNCKEVACKLADALNGELDLRIGSRLYPDWLGKGLPRPFHATRLHTNSYVYCFAPLSVANSCTDCTYVAAVKGVTINGTSYPFVGNLDPTDSTHTLTSQLSFLADQINTSFETKYGEFAHAGRAYTTGSYSDCCAIQLHVNTCDSTFILYDAADAPIAKTTTNPFTLYGTTANTQSCIDCGDAPTTTAYDCGIRVIAERIKGDCDCYVGNPLSFYGRKIDIKPFSDGWKKKPWKVVEVQAMELPSGFGAWIQYLEYQTLPEGKGRNFSRSNNIRGTFLSLPEKKARVNQVTAKCGTNYCSYYFKLDVENMTLIDKRGYLTIHGNVHIPAADSVTVTAWQTFQANLLALNPACEVIGTSVCDTSLGVCE